MIAFLAFVAGFLSGLFIACILSWQLRGVKDAADRNRICW